MDTNAFSAEILAEIERLQEIQKRTGPKSEAWENASALLQPLFAEMARREPTLRPGSNVLHGTRTATVLAIDSDPSAHVWIVYADDPDEDAMVHRTDLAQPCALCEREPATVDALDDDRAVRVCAGCFAYYADGES